MTVALSTLSPAWIASIAFSEPAPPIMVNSSRPAFSIAARTPTPWSSSWFHRKSICGAAWSRLRRGLLAALDGEVGGDPVVDVQAALGERVLEALAAVLGQRQRVDAGDLGDDGVRRCRRACSQTYWPAETPMP